MNAAKGSRIAAAVFTSKSTLDMMESRSSRRKTRVLNSTAMTTATATMTPLISRSTQVVPDPAAQWDSACHQLRKNSLMNLSPGAWICSATCNAGRTILPKCNGLPYMTTPVPVHRDLSRQAQGQDRVRDIEALTLVTRAPLSRSQSEIYISEVVRIGLNGGVSSAARACSAVRQRRLTSSLR